MIYECLKNSKDFEEITKLPEFFKVLTEENRIRILCLLRNGEMCVCEIWKALGLSQNLTSHHLKVLKDLGLVRQRKDGLKVFYSLDRKVLSKHLNMINKLLSPKL